MNYPIVQVQTKGETRLHGLYLQATKSTTVFINIHGTAGNFYEEYFIEEMSKKFLDTKISMLSVNNRGAGVYDAYQKSGAAVEKFEDCVIDIDAWIEFVLQEGHKKIILSGHSLGTEKVVYYMSNGKYRDKISAVVLLAPSDSYGSHRTLNGEVNHRITHIEQLIKESEGLVEQGLGETFLPRDSYGSHEGIMPKSAYSFLNFLGPKSELLKALPFNTEKLETYSKITVPILVVIGDGEEYTAIQIIKALKLMRQENKNTRTTQFKNCNHDFEGKETELAELVSNFINDLG